MIHQKLIWSVVVSLKFTMKKFMIYWVKMSRLECSLSKIRKKEYLWKIFFSWKLIILKRWNSTWNLGLKVEQSELPTWMLNLLDLIVSSPSILIRNKVIRKEIKSIKLPSWTWLIWLVLKEPVRQVLQVMEWNRLLKSTCL